MQKQMADATSGRKAGCGRFPPTPCFPEERDGSCWGWNAVRLPATHGEGETMQAEACDAEVVLTENNPLATASARTPRKWRNEMDDDIRTLLGERIRQFRKTRGWRQVDFAEKLGVSKQCVANWENGGFLPSILTLMRLCEVFSVSTDHLLGLDGHKRIDVTGLSDLQVAHLQTVADDMASDDSAPKGDAAPSDETAPSSDTVPTDGFDVQTAMGDDRKDAIVERMIEAVGIIIANHGISKPQEERKRMAGELVSEVIKAVIATRQVVVPPIPAPTTVLRLPLVAELTGCGVRSLQTMGSAGKLKIVWKDGEQCVELREFDKVWDVNFATTDNLEHLLDGDEAAAILNISTQELYNLVRYHKKHPKSAGLPSHKGRHTRRVYLASELKAYMKRDPHRYRHALTGKARSEKLKVFRSLGREQVGNSQKEDDQHD